MMTKLLSIGIAVILVASLFSTIGVNFVNAASTFKILHVGDVGCESSGQKTVSRMLDRQTATTFVSWNGDLSYKSSMTCFFDMTSGFGEKDTAVIGNHDDESSSLRKQLIDHWELPSSGFYTKSIDVPGNEFENDILFIGMDSESSMGSGSAQFNFVKNALESNAAKEHPAPFIMVALHKPFLTCGGHHGSNGQFGTYQPVFKQYGVDVIAQGHNHNIMYFKPIDGASYELSGAGGRSHYDITSCPKPTIFTDKSNYGFTELDLNFDTGKYTGQFVKSSDGSVPPASKFEGTFVDVVTPPPVEICDDGIDNDNDGLVDEDCPVIPPEPPVEICGDGIDNDLDGQVDETCPPGEEICGDEKDNDGDGKVDEDCPEEPPTANETGFGEVKVIDISASTFQDPNVPENTMDNMLQTRWSAEGNPQSITYQFNQSWVVDKVGVAFYKGTMRTADFDINNQFFKSSGTTDAIQNFTINQVNTSSLTINGHGNSDNDWNSLTEVKIFGSINGTAPPPEPPPECPVGTVWDPITQTCEELPPPPEPPGNGTHFNVTIGAGIATFVPDDKNQPIFETEVTNGTAILPKP